MAMGEKQCAQRKPTLAQGEQTTQKGHSHLVIL